MAAPTGVSVKPRLQIRRQDFHQPDRLAHSELVTKMTHTSRLVLFLISPIPHSMASLWYLTTSLTGLDKMDKPAGQLKCST